MKNNGKIKYGLLEFSFMYTHINIEENNEMGYVYLT